MTHSIYTSPARGQLAERLRIEGLVVIAEVYPPRGVDGLSVLQRYAPLHHILDAVNVADSPMAMPRMSGLAMAAMFERTGMPTILNLTCRDRNRIALQSELLGAAALGVQGVFCVSGESVERGDHPGASAVFDMDSLRLIGLAQRLRTEGTLANGEALETLPTYLLGAAGSLVKEPFVAQTMRTAAKVDAGADFIQTPAMFDLNHLRTFVSLLSSQGTLDRARLIAGVALVTRAEKARWLQQKRPELRIPARFVDRLVNAPEQEQRALGLSYAADMLDQIRDIRGVEGILLYPFDNQPEDIDAMGELLAKVGFA